MRSTVRYCPDPATVRTADAFWNGEQMVYGDGYLADDVVGHELTHGVTQFTSDLFYYAESGAINESISDVMGELIDLAERSGRAGDKWVLGEAVVIGAIRNMANPPPFNDPDRMTSPLYNGELDDSRGVHATAASTTRLRS